MIRSWATFEEKVRGIAGLIWGRPALPEHIGGVQVDAVAHLDPRLTILIEITEERNLGKVREDIDKLLTAQNALQVRRVIARAYCVVNAASVTTAMIDAGTPHDIKVMTFSEFSRIFFDFPQYKVARLNAPFGSAVNPLTGERDDTGYVPVRYKVDGRDIEYGANDISELLRSGKHVVLLGEYGSGKSRCVGEIFRQLASATPSDVCHPIAIDLREAWGLRRWSELLRRHFDDLGLDPLSNNAIKAFNSGSVLILLDGFDELGSQAWNNDPARLRAIRARALQGVKDLVQRCKGGVLVAGREHYFPSNEEMFNALGVTASDCVVIRSKEEFTDSELQEFFDQRGIDVEIPPWLPRRPLICQTINNLPDEDRDRMFDFGANETAFWDYFMRVLCVRDARIHVSFDPDTIYGVLKRLSRLTRTKSSNVGPVTLTDMQKAFEDIVGQPPGEEASVMLQRLPSLGRLGRESDDRQFTDTYILDGLRAKDVAEIAISSRETIRELLHSVWANGLDALGQRILANEASCSDSRLTDLCRDASEAGNKTLSSDAVAALIIRNGNSIDFHGLQIVGGHFVNLDLSKREVRNLIMRDCTFGKLILGNRTHAGVQIVNSLVEKVTGASSARALPDWLQIQADKFESVDNTASIRRIGLLPAQQMLATTIRKTFFQHGSGRKEEALTRGFTRIGPPGMISKVLNLLVSEGILETRKGSEGALYLPVRRNTDRVKRILDELATSRDPLWLAVSAM